MVAATKVLATGGMMTKTNYYTLVENHQTGSFPQREEFISNDTDKISGLIGFIELNSGIHLHFSDTTELVDDTFEREAKASITISLLLEGEIQFSMNDISFSLGSKSNGSKNKAYGNMWSLTEPVKFSRKFKRGHKVKKIIITINHDWLADMGLAKTLPHLSLGLDKNLNNFASTHLECRNWTPSKRAIQVAQEIIHPPHKAECMRKMMREFRALELVTIAFESFSTNPVEKTPSDISDNCRLIKVHSYIEKNLFRELTLDEIAKNVGFSVSSLQRHFKATYGATVVDYIRHRKLNYAKEMMEENNISITEVAHMVGYSTPSSFTTAFKRTFGYSPNSIARPQNN